ncbi:hypothetical protein KK641_004694 [Salmonella enterica subsp. enterica serovar Mbandaka]|nr:hypothetical protein [Salmonella enterica subsp. enterica serovar Mbandaka]EIM9078530.1 hypothetical protein [Salmonella enterica subsp. enterica serovar Cerro]
MAKVQGLFVGYRKFAVDRQWLRQQEEQRYRDRQRQFDEWSRKWVTVTRLKEGSAWKTESMVTPVFATPILTTSWLA